MLFNWNICKQRHWKLRSKLHLWTCLWALACSFSKQFDHIECKIILCLHRAHFHNWTSYWWKRTPLLETHSAYRTRFLQWYFSRGISCPWQQNPKSQRCIFRQWLRSEPESETEYVPRRQAHPTHFLRSWFFGYERHSLHEGNQWGSCRDYRGP